MRFSSFQGAYEIDSMPSQPQVAVCHAFYVPLPLRKQGLAHQLKAHQKMTLASLGYDYAVCTVRSSNTAQRQVLQTAGWRMLCSFVSGTTGEPVEMWGWTVTTHTEKAT